MQNRLNKWQIIIVAIFLAYLVIFSADAYSQVSIAVDKFSRQAYYNYIYKTTLTAILMKYIFSIVPAAASSIFLIYLFRDRDRIKI